MKLFTEKARMLSVVTLVMAFVLTLGLALSGCSSSDDNDKPVEVNYANLIVKNNLTYARAIGTDIKSIILSGYDAKGALTFSPAEYARTTTITKAVPVTTTSVRMSYMDSEKGMVGLYVQPVSLQQGADYIISDPAWQNIEEQSFVSELAITPEEHAMAVNNYVQFDVVGSFNANGSSFVQNVTNEVNWVLADTMAVLQDQGKGSFKSTGVGSAVVTAEFANCSVDALVTVVGNDPSLRFVSRSIRSEQGAAVYRVPLSLQADKAKNGLGFDLMPATWYLEGDINEKEEDAKYITLTSSHEEIATAELATNEKEGIVALLLHPHKLGTTVVTAVLDNPSTGKYCKSTIQIDIINAEFESFVINENENDSLCGDKEAYLGQRFIASVFGAYIDEQGREIDVDFTGVCTNSLKRVDADIPHSELSKTLEYLTPDGSIVAPCVEFSNGVDDIYGNSGDVYEWTCKVPEGFTIINKPSDEVIGDTIVCTITMTPAIPVRVVFVEAGSTNVVNYENKMQIGDELSLAIGKVYSNNEVVNSEAGAKLDIVNNGVLEITENEDSTILVKAVKAGRAVITVSLNEEFESSTYTFEVSE